MADLASNGRYTSVPKPILPERSFISPKTLRAYRRKKNRGKSKGWKYYKEQSEPKQELLSDLEEARLYTNSRLQAIGIEENYRFKALLSGGKPIDLPLIKEGSIPMGWTDQHSNPVYKYGFGIVYTDHLGVVTQDHTGDNYLRYRFLPKHEYTYQNGSIAKYHGKKGSEVQLYFSALYAFFISKGIPVPSVVFVEGELKAIALCAAGIPAIGVGGIHNFANLSRDEFRRVINIEVKPALTRFVQDCEVKNIRLLHDADADRNQGKPHRARSFASAVYYFYKAIKNAGFEGLKINYSVVRGEYKGIDDLLQASTKEERSSILDSLRRGAKSQYFQHFSLGGYGDLCRVKEFLGDYRKPFVKYRKLKGKYLSDQLEELMVYINPEAGFRLAISLGTGGGKTYCFLQELPKRLPGVQMVYVCPQLTLIEQSLQELSAAGAKVATFTGGVKNWEVLKESDIILTTYDSFRKLVESQVLRNNRIVVCDEMHYPISNRHWKENGSGKLYSEGFGYILKEKNIVAISGTMPFDILNYLKFNCLHFDRKEYTKLLYQPINFSGCVVSELVEKITGLYEKHGTKLKLIVRLNDSTKHQEIINRLPAGLQSESLHAGNQDNSPAWLGIKHNAKLPDSLNVLLVTKLIDAGINIDNLDITAVIVADKQKDIATHEDVKQFAGRVRKMPELHVIHYRNSGNQATYFQPPARGKWLNQIELAKIEAAKCNLFHTNPAEATEMHGLVFPTGNSTANMKALGSNNLVVNTGSNPSRPYEINYLYIASEMAKREATSYDSEAYIWRMKNFEDVELFREVVEIETKELPGLQEERKNTKRAFEQAEQQAFDLVGEYPAILLEAYVNITNSRSPFRREIKKYIAVPPEISEGAALFIEKYPGVFKAKGKKKPIDKAVSRWLQLKNNDIEPSKENLALSDQVFKQVIESKQARQAVNDFYSGKITDGESVLICTETINRIEALGALEGEVVTAEQVKDVLNEVSRTPGLKILNQRKAMRWVRMFFDVKETGGRKDGRKYILSGGTDLLYNIKEKIKPVKSPKPTPVPELQYSDECPF